MTTFIATQLGAIVKEVYAKNSNNVFCYKDIQIAILQNLKMGNRDVLIMEVTLCHIKRGLSQKKPKVLI